MEAPPDPGSKIFPEQTTASAPPPRGPTVKGPGGRTMQLGSRGPRWDRQSWRFVVLGLVLIGLGSLTTLVVAPPPREQAWQAWRPGWWIRPLVLNAQAGLTTLPDADIHDLYLTRGASLLAGAEDGLLYRRADGSDRWELTELPQTDEAVAGFFDRGKFAVGAFTKSGALWVSEDDGETWERVPPEIAPDQSDPVLTTLYEDYEPAQAKAPDTFSYAQTTAQNVPPSPTPLPLALRQIDPVNFPEGVPMADLVAYGKIDFLALTRRGESLNTESGGLTWRPMSGVGGGLYDLLMPATRRPIPDVLYGFTPFQIQRRPDTLWTLGVVNSDYRGAFGSNVAAVAFRAAGDVQAVACPELLRLSVSEDDTLWGFDADGTLFRHDPSTRDWEECPAADTGFDPVRAIAAIDSERVYVAGTGGRLWEFDWFTGESTPLSRNALTTPVAGSRLHLPPPLFLFAALGLLLSSRRLLRRQPEPDEIQDIAEIFVSDRPLQQSDVDYLNFGPYVRGLSSYLRNASTQPPLTVAITGAWGSGKTSMMTLLKEDLEGRGFCPVWFNAWHHQRDEGLLAALLQNVKTQAVPDPVNRAGVRYRWRLFLKRALDQKMQTGVSVLTFVAGVVMFSILLFDPTFPVFEAIDTFMEELVKVNEKGVFSYLADVLTVVSSGAILAPLLYVLKTLRSFGVKPSALLTKPEGQATRRQLDEKAGFRHRFSQEFAEVAESLQPLSLVIMIDDLDRCEPRAVFEVLEAINFLSSAGKCFIVLGMDEERVQDCVAANCREMGIVPPRFHNGAEAASNEEAKYRDALEFASAYMEKMIQVRIAVPRADTEAAAKLVAGDPGRPFSEEPERKPPPAWLQPLGVAAALVGAIVVGLGGANFIKSNYQETQAAAPAAVAVAAGPAATETAPAAPPPGTPGASEALFDWFSPWRDRVLPEKTYLPGRSFDLALIGVLLLGLGIGAVGYPQLLAPARNVVVKDTPEFIEAARRWAPLVFARNPTPRNLKAFLNRVRYYAMLLRGEFGHQGAIPEGVEASLVAFAAVEHALPGWFRMNDHELELLFNRTAGTVEAPFQEEIRRLRQDPVIHQHRSLFERLSRHVRM